MMTRGSKTEYKPTRKNAQSEKSGSDEDYVEVDDLDPDESDDEYSSSLAEDESEENLVEFEKEDQEEVDQTKIKMDRSGGRNSLQGRRNGVTDNRKKRNASYSEREECNNDNLCGVKRRKNNMSSDFEEDYSDSDYDDDTEVALDEEVGLNDVKECTVMTKKVSRPRMRVTQVGRVQKRRRNGKAVKKVARKQREIEEGKSSCTKYGPGIELRDWKPISRRKKRIVEKCRRRKKPSVNSSSDCSSSGSSDHDYTISEKEKEQVREADKFCRRLKGSLTSSSFSNMLKEVETGPSERKLSRKGKEEVGDMKTDAGKQICGICLSEEDKRAVRGILNCCRHYFCFTCIIDWSKVESRCPLCKQRFSTIRKTARFGIDVSLRDTVISVPERDQVYQPSEEELRSYLDPYENVLCSECHQDGDDALMLLCDLCDSSAHTYCVGLGREVPEGNWYCDGCNLGTLASSNVQAPSPASTSEGNCNLAAVSFPRTIIRESSDLSELHVPEIPLIRVTGHTSFPRHSTLEFQHASSASGSGVSTLLERRRIQRHICQLLYNRSRNSERYDGMAQVSGSSLVGQIGPDGVIASQYSFIPARMPPQNIIPQGRLSNYLNQSLHNNEVFSPRLSSLTGQILDSQASASLTPSFRGLCHNEFTGFNSRIFRGLGHLPSHPCRSQLSYSTETIKSPPQFTEGKPSPTEKERVQLLVKSHLKSLSRDLELGYRTFKDIARTSTHTILYALGVEHRWSEVYPVRGRPLRCDHSQSLQTFQIGGQCASCFDWFVRNLVREVMCARVSHLSTY